MKVTIFFSWQSDTRAAANRTLIQAALEAAAAELRDDESISVQPVVDRDTMAVPGAPDIGATIFEKIDASAAFVADVTIINSGAGDRPTPNPNVLIELGFALKSLGDRRLILVQNVASGGPELLPFDLRQKRVLRYNSPEEVTSRVEERYRLQSALRDALALILAQDRVQPTPEFSVKLAIGYEKKLIRSERHDYQLQVTLENVASKPITQWHVDVEFPTRPLEPNVTHHLRVPERSDRDRSLFRVTQDNHRGAIYPGDKKIVMTIDYMMDSLIFYEKRGLFDQRVTAIAYVHGELAATTEKVFRELQCF